MSIAEPIDRTISGNFKKIMIDTKITYKDGILKPDPATIRRTTSVTFNGRAVPLFFELSLGKRQFANFHKLRSINLEVITNLKDIPAKTFWKCSSLKNIIIPASVTEIGSRAFVGCKRLDNLIIKDSVEKSELEKIGSYAFSNCSRLNNVILPASVTEIGESAFSNCSRLGKFDLPGHVTEIKPRTFKGCANLRNMDIPADSKLTTIGANVFEGCQSLLRIVLPSTMTTIAANAFTRWCPSKMGQEKALVSISLQQNLKPPLGVETAWSAFETITYDIRDYNYDVPLEGGLKALYDLTYGTEHRLSRVLELYVQKSKDNSSILRYPEWYKTLYHDDDAEDIVVQQHYKEWLDDTREIQLMTDSIDDRIWDNILLL